MLQALYEENYLNVERFVRKNRGSSAQARDLYQEAFVTVWQNIHKGSFQPENLKVAGSYLYRVSKNKWLDFLKSKEYRMTESLEISRADKAVEEEDGTQEREQVKLLLVREAFEKLGKECKRILGLFYFENNTSRQIANAMDMAEASTRNKKYRCMQKLRESVFKKEKK